MNQNWHDWRREGIGSSDAPVVMGVSPWNTPHKLWKEKVFGISDDMDNPSMKRGRDLEETARREFEKIIGTLVAPSQVVHPKIQWMRATLDGMDITGDIIVEIKCPNKEDHSTAVGKKVPEKYWPQVQHQIEVTGAKGMYYFSFDGSEGVIVEVARDQAYIDHLLESERQFWDMVASKTPPQLTDRDYVCMDGNKEWEKFAVQMIEIQRQKKALEEKDDELRGLLKSLSQGRSAKGHGISMQRQICTGAVDYSKIPKLQGVDLDPYRKKSFEKWCIRSI